MLRSPNVVMHIVMLTVCVLATTPAGADVYKYKDDKGNTLYTDKPATLPAERLNVATQKTDTVAVKARAEAEQTRMQSASQARQQSSSQRAEDQAASQLTSKDKADRCAKARERYDLYMNSQKLYENQSNGERRFLTAEEIDTARASAKASMEVMCQ